MRFIREMIDKKAGDRGKAPEKRKAPSADLIENTEDNGTIGAVEPFEQVVAAMKNSQRPNQIRKPDLESLMARPASEPAQSISVVRPLPKLVSVSPAAPKTFAATGATARPASDTDFKTRAAASAPNIWDIDDGDEGDDAPDTNGALAYGTALSSDREAAAANPVNVPEPAVGRAGRRAGRVTTRLLGFEHSDGTFEDHLDQSKAVPAAVQAKFPVGWIVIIDGPGRGEFLALQSGLSQIGRGTDQAIQLDFGDTSISRSNHAAIAYDPDEHKFYLGHGGKSNIVRLNGKPVLSTEVLSDADIIKIGETTLRFVSLCNESFNWKTQEAGGDDDVALT